ncbi:FtsX-like permease family protein [Anaerobutyricum hallii]|uniref:ABC transporter permease n=1 Tax=Anaerobutyricum hallii TaxID=39488 RepID=UPI003A870809
MNSKIYGKLAVTNLKNNRKNYLPYILASAFSVMMYFIMDGLYRNPSLVKTGATLSIMLSYANVVLLIFSVIFLFYINSFLIKRRKKELGIYNILGMGKGHLAKMLFIESIITTTVSIIGGILAGILFGKLVYLVLLKILHLKRDIVYMISPVSVGITAAIFGCIFFVIFLYNLVQMKLSNPIELLRGGNAGEREPKTKWLMTIIGSVCLAGGYYISLTTKEPLQAIGQFFVAVLLVVAGTYALFMAGSITLLKLLRKKKSYYYKTRHFTAISGMIYRMKQNAVGLANICILSTMVLVMVSITISLYAGMNDVLVTRFPSEAQITNQGINQNEERQIGELVASITKENHTNPTSQIRFHEGNFTALYNDKTKNFNMTTAQSYGDTNIVEFVMIPLSDYNKTEGKAVKLADNEVLIYHRKNKNKSSIKNEETIHLNNDSYKVAANLDSMRIAKADATNSVDGWYVIVKDTNIIKKYLKAVYGKDDMEDSVEDYHEFMQYVYSFNLDGSRTNRERTEQILQEQLQAKFKSAFIEGRELSRENFYNFYGGFLFIGIFLGIIFLMATVLIIYYKQISEGYDDRERYQIMQKVGMSKKEVRQSIRSQVLLVFFLPLIMAVIHLAFAFKIITRLLSVLNLTNISLFFMYTVGTVAVFAVIYVIIYSITAREYYKIIICRGE